MTVPHRQARTAPALRIGFLIAAATLLLVAANAHLVYVAVTSQPDCVAHVKAGQPGAGAFSAAKPAC